ncbi:MAG: S9 family peptidase [Chloroflexota bacterium]
MTGPTRRLLALSDLSSIQGVSDPRISPDGRRVAFVVETIEVETNQIRERIWLVEVDGSAGPLPLTTGDDRETEPRWSPDGQILAYVSNHGGTRQVWRRALDGGEPRQMTNHPIGAHEPVWSPNGRQLAFVAAGPDRRGDPLVVPEKDDRKRLVRVRQHRHKLDGVGFFGPLRGHVWTVSLDDGATRQVTDGPSEDLSPTWSPDGTRIAFVSDRSPDRDWHFGGGALHVVELATDTFRRLTSEDGRAAHPSWSPDGAWLVYAGGTQSDDASPSHTHLWVVDAKGEDPRCLTDDQDRSVGLRPGGYLTTSSPVWTPDGASIVYLAVDGPSTQLACFSDHERVSLTTGRRVVQSFSLDRSGDRAAVLIADPVTPAEIWLWENDGEGRGVRPRPLSNQNAPLLSGLDLAAPEDLQITRPEGTRLEGWLLRPPSATSTAKLPLILVVHGGPHNYFGDTFSFDHQLFAALGYVVLYLNPRGSGGRDEAFARAVCSDWGGKDFEDLMAMLDHVIARGDPPIDERRLAITGSSYGGFITCQAITLTDRFAVAIAGACISNLISFFGTSDIGESWGVAEFGGTPSERLDWYLERSPALHVDRVHTPLLLYHGESDLRCPIEQSEQMFSALHRFGKTVEFLRVPTESHGVLSGSPVHRIAAREAIVEWLGQYLG